MNYGSYQRGVYAKLFRGYADLFLIGLQVQGSGVPVYFGCWVAGVTVKANNVEGCVGWLAAAVSNNAMFVCVAIYGFATRGSSWLPRVFHIGKFNCAVSMDNTLNAVRRHLHG